MPSQRISWKRKLSLFFESLVDTILEAILVAVYILLTYGLSLLIKYTIGEKWRDIGDTITHGALIVVGTVGALQLVVTTVVRTYRKLKREFDDDSPNA